MVHHHGHGHHGHSHQHGHHDHSANHKHSSTPMRRIGLALVLNLCFALIEFIGGLYTGSVAILSDALHDFGDSLSLAFALILERFSLKGSDAKYSYGYRRLSLLSALFTAGFLIAGSVLVLTQAIPRLTNPTVPNTEGMFFLALLGVAVNGFAAWRVSTGKTLNEKMISWHLFEDVLGWVAILIVSIIMHFVDLPILDPLLAVLFTLYILRGVLLTLKATVRLFLQAVPDSVSMAKMRASMSEIKQVVSFHDMHLWSLDGESHVLTMHVVVKNETTLEELEVIKTSIRKIVASQGKIHATIEIETVAANCPDIHCVQDF